MSDEAKSKVGGLHAPPVETRFKPGQSGNPGGRPVGARHRLTSKFIHALADDFEAHGLDAIAKCREKSPEAYLRAIAALCPKEVELKRPLQDMEDAELHAALRTLESFLASGATAAGSGSAGEPAKTH